MGLRGRLTGLAARLGLLLAVLGPGMITSNVDNDAGGIYTYSVAGARYGYELLWILVPVTLALIVVQEMCARMGTVTGKGLADLIREEFGLRVTFLLMMVVLFTNLGNAAANFAGLASALEDDAQVMSNTHLNEQLAGQPDDIRDEIVRINTDVRPRALQVGLLIPIASALIGLVVSFRMTRLSDLKPSSTAEDLGVL